MNKHEEKSFQNKALIYLGEHYNAMAWTLNSGKAYQGRYNYQKNILENVTHINLCPEGTPDVMCLLPNGVTVFIEMKSSIGRQRESQKKWQAAAESRGHNYILARTIEDIERGLKLCKVKK